jgi:WD40 repeat protein
MRLDWHPQSDELLVTARTNNMTRTLLIVSMDRQSRPFPSLDKQVARWDGAWSPDGKQIVYVANMNINTSESGGGSIWVANSDGSSPREIVKGDQNFAPLWAPRGDLLFFTRLLTETGGYELYRIKPDGQDQPVFVGEGAGPPSSPAINRHTLLDWSPDGEKLFFQSFDQQQRRMTLYGALYDGSNPQPLFSQPIGVDPTLVYWAPTSRALLIASQSQGMLLRWIDQDRPATQLPRGFFPSWQPWK